MICDSGFFELGAGQYARMPARDWFAVPLTVEQLLAAGHLRVFPITNLEPGARFTLRDVRRSLLFGDYAFEIQPAHLVE